MVAAEFTRKLKIRVLCLPDIDKAIGGVKQLYRHVEHLVALGWDAAMITEAGLAVLVQLGAHRLPKV